jgi:hypothetical protein
MGRHVLDRAQELKVEGSDAFEEAMAAGIVEGQRRHALFDDGRAPAVLDLVEEWSALPIY